MITEHISPVNQSKLRMSHSPAYNITIKSFN